MTSKNEILLNYEPRAQEWASNVIREWEYKVSALDIKGDDLIDSFKRHVGWNASGNSLLVKFAYDYVGRFVEWGVGNGVNLQIRDALISAGLTKRRPKPWMSEVFKKQVAIINRELTETLSRDIGIIVAKDLTISLDDTIKK